MYSQSFTSFHVECTDLENTPKKSRKIYLRFNPEQKAIIRNWFGVARFVYNQTIELLRDGVIKANWKKVKGSILANLPDWCKDTPYQIKSIAIKDACKAVSNAKLKFQNTGVFSDFNFKSRKDPKQSCYIPKSAVSEKGIYHTILGSVKYTEPLPQNFGDCRLVCAYGDYYLAVPGESLQLETENQGRVVALDPGIRTFLTFFSESSFGWLGKDANIKIQKLCFKLDELCSVISKSTGQVKRRFKKAANRIRAKIKNLVSELHKKTALFLIKNFDVILLPTFETSQMAKKGKRRIRSKSVRQMLTLSHYKFKEFIKHKALEHNKIVIDVSEAYTSKTVSWSGEIVKNLGGSKIIKSESTGQQMDRDLNGARGIFLRALVDTPFLRENLRLCIC
ncbi:RNA-guided endonuclease InsQ/TnpB family protein [Dulcicalothrix desertica]|uniref:RNA-guided endonuclease InsQ/TnpB family protein n=1 Tax=Dulcicalothrix desertica TaxID=32056 RepID=UPI001F260D54|nr:transposase [Dulcicalothrix desertica]